MAHGYFYECDHATQIGKYHKHASQINRVRVGDDKEKIAPASVRVQKCEKADGTLPCTDGIHHESQATCQCQHEAGEDKLAYTESSSATKCLPPNNSQCGPDQTQSQCTEYSHDSLLLYNYVYMLSV